MKKWLWVIGIWAWWAVSASAQVANPLSLHVSRSVVCAGDTFQVWIPGGIHSLQDIEAVVLSTLQYGGIEDSLAITLDNGRITCRTRKTTVGANDYSVALRLSSSIYTSSTSLQVVNPLTAAVSSNHYTFGFTYKDRLVFLSRVATPIAEAAALARASGGDLPRITDAVYNAKLAALADTDGNWFDFTDRYLEGQWRTNRLAKGSYLDWAPGEPNNAGGVEDYAVIRRDTSWNDQWAMSLHRHFLEINTSYRDTIFTVPGGALWLQAPRIAGASYTWLGPNGFFATDSLLTIDRVFIPPTGLASDQFGLIVTKDGCASDLVTYPAKPQYEGLDTALFAIGPSYKGQRYYCSKFTATLGVARMIGYLTGSRLAEIRNQAENDIAAAFYPQENKWIGVTDSAAYVPGQTPRRFRYFSSDSTITFANWRQGEPNNHAGREPYVHLFGVDGTWNDMNPQFSIRFVLTAKESVVALNPTDQVVCPGSVDSLVAYSIESLSQCKLQVSDPGGDFSQARQIPFEVLRRNQIRFQWPTTMPLATGYRLRLADTVRGLYDYAIPGTVEVGSGGFLAPLLRVSQDTIYVTNPYAGASYTWAFQGNPITTGGVGPYFVASQVGFYTVTASRNACSSTSQPIGFQVLNINKLASGALGIYPNPAAGFVSITAPGSGRLVVTALDGRTVAEFTMAKAGRINVSGWAKGLYGLAWTDQQGRALRAKLVVD